jgi:dTDP-4-amino-4,6-dideoxygalactose transaminase
MSDSIEFYRHALPVETAAAVEAVIASPFLTSGAVCKKVEGMLCESFGASHAFLTGSRAFAVSLAFGPIRGDSGVGETLKRSAK